MEKKKNEAKKKKGCWIILIWQIPLTYAMTWNHIKGDNQVFKQISNYFFNDSKQFYFPTVTKYTHNLKDKIYIFN